MSDTPMVEMMILEKRIAELEAELEHIRERYKLQGQHLLQKDAENQRLLDALKEIKLKVDYYSEIHAIAEQALEEEI